MKDKLFTASEGHNPNYMASICRIDKLEPIENSDFLLKTIVDGFDIVVSNKTKLGDIVVYCPSGSSLNFDFLGVNNQYEIEEYERNSNSKEVSELLAKDEKEKAKLMCGFFNRQGRVKSITLRGCPSIGFVTPVETLVTWKPSLVSVNWSDLVGASFDTIDDELFIKKFIKPIAEQRSDGGGGRVKKRAKHLKKFDKLIEGQFEFHYDTNMLNTNMHNIGPDDVVTITLKKHGTSASFSKILCNKILNFKEKIKKLFGFKVVEVQYDYVHSSRSVVKNRYINPKSNSYYSEDVWTWASKYMNPLLDEGMSVYCEIFGYRPNSSGFIQNRHDYGCNPSPSHPKHTLIMPYRITITDVQGNKTEWKVSDVEEWTKRKLEVNPELPITPITILHHGTFMELYPDVEIDPEWHGNILAKLKAEKRFGMEEVDPTCSKFPITKGKYFQAPVEGIVVRKDSDAERGLARAWKLKTARHYNMETAQQDAGEEDMETTESSCSDND